MQTFCQDELRDACERAVLKAAARVLSFVKRPQAIQSWRKSDGSLVMNLDMEAHAILKEELCALQPLVSEEDEASHKLIETHRDYILLDPIDGTSSCRRFLSTSGGQLGFGPLLGIVRNAALEFACFYHVPSRTLYSAARGEGSFAWRCDAQRPNLKFKKLQQRRRLRQRTEAISLEEAALLFYPGSKQEVGFVQHLKEQTPIENTYRFGGFANDCTRLAEGYEQAQIQLSVKAWDFPAVLLALESGAALCMDPALKRQNFEAWKICANNPVLIAHESLYPELLRLFIEWMA